MGRRKTFDMHEALNRQKSKNPRWIYNRPDGTVAPLDDERAEQFRRALPETDYVVSLFRAMSHETRLSLLWFLTMGEWCVHDLAALLGASPSNTSHHLRLLRVMRLVKGRKAGRRVLYSLDDEHVRGLLIQAFEHANHS